MLPQQFQVATRFALGDRAMESENAVASQYDFGCLLPLTIEEADAGRSFCDRNPPYRRVHSDISDRAMLPASAILAVNAGSVDPIRHCALPNGKTT
jgi:hypothetical protein